MFERRPRLLKVHGAVVLFYCALVALAQVPAAPTHAAGRAPALGAEKLTAHPALDYFPAPSADGRYLAFVSERSGNPDIWLKPMTAGVFAPPRQLTTHPGRDLEPSLDRNGSRLLYVSFRGDARGDIFLLDVITGKETRLTDGLTGESTPGWGHDPNVVYYLRDQIGGGRELVRHSILTKDVRVIVGNVTSYSIHGDGWIVYSDGRQLFALNESSQPVPAPLLGRDYMDLWPALLPDHTVVFTRYQEDSNGDGRLDTDDESSIWMGRWDLPRQQRTALYRVTPAHRFHLYSAGAAGYAYFADLQSGDIHRIALSHFLQDYASLEKAEMLAARQIDRRDTDAALLTLTNISSNLTANLSLEERAKFDFDLVEMLREVRAFAEARTVLERYDGAEGRLGAFHEIHAHALGVEEQAEYLSSPALKKVARRKADQLLAIGTMHGTDQAVKALALVEAGKLLILADEPVEALDYLVRVDALDDEEMRARALFARGRVYRRLGQDEDLLHVYVDVIDLFGEESVWGQRAIDQAVAVVQERRDVREQIASLASIAEEYRRLPYLSGSALLRAAELYEEEGEQLQALDMLNRAIESAGKEKTLVAEAYRRKGRLLASMQNYREAAEAYAAVVELTGLNQEDLALARRLMVLQLVRSAVKKRSIGEARIAAKDLRGILEQYPDSVEAHRYYIETKVMLNETAEVQAFYQERSWEEPANAVYRYAWGLALSYSNPPDLRRVIALTGEAAAAEPGISYFHQTLGWAHEQSERTEGPGGGHLEQAEREYRIALELNDSFQFPDVEADLLLNLGNTYFALGNYGEAYRHYRRRVALRAPPRDDETERQFLKKFGEACFKTGKTEESIEHYQEALRRVQQDQSAQRAELLERIALSHQELGDYAQAVRYFSEALEVNLESGSTDNLALLRRNIGVNLYNLSLSGEQPDRESLKNALASYFASLEAIETYGAQDRKAGDGQGAGLFQLEVALGQSGTEAAAGFDRVGEEKLMFSYIASTYEQLSEPRSAREFYGKKLSLLPQATGQAGEAAAGAEEAIVLNRMGVLSHQLGETSKAMEYSQRSLARTRELGLDYGTVVNLYNMSRIAVEWRLDGRTVGQSVLEEFLDGAASLSEGGRRVKLFAYVLANIAFVLASAPLPSFDESVTVQERIRALHSLYHAKQHAVRYYEEAVELLQDDRIASPEEARPVLLVLNMNLMELARSAGKTERYAQLRSDVQDLLDAKPSAGDWLVHLFEAERVDDDVTREALLGRSLDALMAVPPQVHPGGRGTLPFYDELAGGYVDLLLKKGAREDALIIADQIHMRKIAAELYLDLGEEFALSGLGEYQEDLHSLIAELRKAFSEGDQEKLNALSGELEDLIYALYEEYPWAVPYLYQYPLTADLLSPVFKPDRPYVKVIGWQGRIYVLVHDGESVPYASSFVPESNRAIPLPEDALSGWSSLYLSIPASLEKTVDLSSLSGKAVTRVPTAYDALGARSRRSLFHSRVAVAGAMQVEGINGEDGRVLSLELLGGKEDLDRQVLAGHHLLLSYRSSAGYGIVVKEERGVRDTVMPGDLISGHKHTVALLGLGSEGPALETRASALIRAGYPHVILHRGEVDDEGAAQFLMSYLSLIDTTRADQAVVLSAKFLAPQGGGVGDVRLYGFAGMDRAERATYASAVYSEAVSEAVAAFQEERFRPALERFEEALSVVEFTGARQEIPQLSRLAVDAAFRSGEYERAVGHQTGLIRYLEEEGDLDAKPEALFQLGILYSRLEEFQPAIENLEAAIEQWDKRDELDRLAEGIATLGVVRENMGAYSGALEAFGKSFELFQEIGELGDMAGQHRRIGRIYYLRLGQYARAREHYLAAMSSYQEIGEDRAEAMLLLEVGLTYERVGLFDEAERYYLSGREIAAGLGDRFLLGTAELYLGNTAWLRGDYQEAFDRLSKASEQAELAEDPQLRIMVANTKALIYWTLNDLDKALVYGRQALAIALREDIKTETASSLNNLGLLLRESGDLNGSLEHFERARLVDLQLKSRWGLGYDYRNIGITQMKLERYVEARENLVRAEQTSAEIHNVNNQVKALLELGNLNRASRTSGSVDEGLGFYERAYQLSTRYGIKEVRWRAAAGKAALLRGKGSQEDALEWYVRAVEVVEGMRAALKLDEFRNSFQVNKQDLYREVIGLLVEMGRTRDAFDYLERSHSRSFIDLLGNQKLALKTEVDQERLDAIKERFARVEALETELGSAEEPEPRVLEQYHQAKAVYQEALLELKRDNPQLGSFVSVDPLTLSEVEAMLGPEAGLLAYKLDTDRTYIWFVTANGTAFREVPAGNAKVSEAVMRYRASVQRLEPVEDELSRLYDLLIRPVESELEGVGYVGIIPDGSLHFLSFAALRDRDAYLVDRHPIFYAPSASVLSYTFAKRQEDSRRRVLAIGNPDLGSYNYDLPLAELEARSIRWDFPDMDILTGSEASKRWVIEHISDYGVIHVAAHGEFDPHNPLLSAILLASDDPDDRRLTVKEVFSLDMRADLVTLSACQTGLGKLKGGELIGLNRAFIYAGTHALVSSLWRVDDLSTSILMKHFYRSYAKLDKASSLRQAQLVVKKEFPHPSYWAGLSLVGDYK